VKSRAYLKWVSEQRCVSCGAWPTEYAPNTAHHIKGVCHLSGGSQKCTDLGTMPLCHKCHRLQHSSPTEQQVQWAFDTLDAAVADGAIKIVGEKD